MSYLYDKFFKTVRIQLPIKTIFVKYYLARRRILNYGPSCSRGVNKKKLLNSHLNVFCWVFHTKDVLILGCDEILSHSISFCPPFTPLKIKYSHSFISKFLELLTKQTFLLKNQTNFYMSYSWQDLGRSIIVESSKLCV
jgi:hypothetical protein